MRLLRMSSPALVLTAAMLGATAQAAIIPGTEVLGNNSGAVSGVFRYDGLGQQGSSGRGTGVYSLGTCGGVTEGFTTCTLSGAYSLTGANTGTGDFLMRMIYPGSQNQITAISQTAGSDELFLLNLNGGRFELDLFPSDGGILSGLFPDNPFENSIGWSAFASDLNCSGLPAGVPCTIGNVGLNAGSTATGGIDRFFFRFPASGNPGTDPPVEVPEPGLLLLLGTGLAGLLLAQHRRRQRERA